MAHGSHYTHTHPTNSDNSIDDTAGTVICRRGLDACVRFALKSLDKPFCRGPSVPFPSSCQRQPSTCALELNGHNAAAATGAHLCVRLCQARVWRCRAFVARSTTTCVRAREVALDKCATTGACVRDVWPDERSLVWPTLN